MISNTLLKMSCLLAAIFILGPSRIEALCNTCSEYGIACVNETYFHVCNSGGKIDTSKAYLCPNGKICTNTRLRCVQPNDGIQPACQPNKGCGECRQDELFACTSRTTFAMCNNGELTKITGVCPDGLFCETRNGGEICKDECGIKDDLECDRETPIKIQ